jgi:hypothetical protein
VKNKPVVNRQLTREELEQMLQEAHGKIATQAEEIKHLKGRNLLEKLAADDSPTKAMGMTPMSRQSLRHGATSARKTSVMFTQASMRSPPPVLDLGAGGDDLRSLQQLQWNAEKSGLEAQVEALKAELADAQRQHGRPSRTPSPPKVLRESTNRISPNGSAKSPSTLREHSRQKRERDLEGIQDDNVEGDSGLFDGNEEYIHGDLDNFAQTLRMDQRRMQEKSLRTQNEAQERADLLKKQEEFLSSYWTGQGDASTNNSLMSPQNGAMQSKAYFSWGEDED